MTDLKKFNKYDSDLAEYTEIFGKIKKIDTKDDMLLARGLQNKIKSTIQEIKGTKELLKRPVIEMGKAIETEYKKTMAGFENIKDNLGILQIAYQTEIEKQREEEARKIKEELEAKKKLYNDEEIDEVLEGKAEDKQKELDNDYELSRQKGVYKDYEIIEVDIFKINRQYLNIKPLEVKADLLAIKKDLKEGKEIKFVKYNLVTKIK